MKKENSDTSTLMPEYNFSKIFYHKYLFEKKVFTQKEAWDMLDILAEIHSALKDKSMNKGGVMKLGQYEIGWLLGIEELLNKINENKIPANHDSG